MMMSNSYQVHLKYFHIIIVIAATCVLSVICESASADPVCGRVTLAGAGGEVELRENVTLSPEVFERLHIQKLKDAVFSPEKDCVIKICGFSSFRTPNHPGYIGSGSDYADCYLAKESNIMALSDIFNDIYNTSSISCACDIGDGYCTENCDERHENWSGDECAILFQENDCHNCYFSPIPLQDEGYYETDNSHHIHSLVVREGCRVTQNISTLNRIWMFREHPGIIVYNTTTRSNVKSAFQSDPESFLCTCGEEPTTATPTTTLPTITSSISTTATTPQKPTELAKPPEEGNGPLLPVLIGLALVAILLFSVLIGVTILRRREVATTAYQYQTEKGSFCASSNGTESTYTGSDSGRGSLDYSQILSLPYDPRFDICKDHFEMGLKLGHGNFGEVFQGTLQVAVKAVKVGNDESGLKSLKQEIKILSYLGIHENVVRMVGACVKDYENGELYMIMEFCQNGSLKSYLQATIAPKLKETLRNDLGLEMQLSEDGYSKDSPVPLPLDLEEVNPEVFNLFMQWSEQIANGMEYITSKKIVHVDLAARNVLLSDNLTAKIGDFGLSRKMYLKNYVDSKKDSIPIRWVAPESLTKNKYSSMSDVWAFGITVWEIFSLGKEPYEDKYSITEVLGALLDGERLDCPEFCPEVVYKKLCECWNESPEFRPPFPDLREFFREQKPTAPALHVRFEDEVEALNKEDIESETDQTQNVDDL